jgi:hypothetical protein
MNAYPAMVKVKQDFRAPKVANVASETAAQLSRKQIVGRISPGSKVAIAVGSRGIADLATIVGVITREVKLAGGDPMIVPAMGSHGGATARGQEEILANYGITPENVGAPVRSSMDVVKVGEVEGGIPVYFDRIASESDHIVVVNRVKPHTNFKSDLESGLMKMLTIGLGKHEGAKTIHSHGVAGLKNLIPQTGQFLLETMPVVFGVAIVENAYEQTARVAAIPAEELVETEKRLLVEAKHLMASLPSGNIDVLLIEEMGKNISGTGMDPNIIGRIYVRGEEEPQWPDIAYIGVLDLTTESHGNAIGLGYADLTTRRLVDKVDYPATYTNSITAVFPSLAKVPITLDTDQQLVEVALKFMEPKRPEEVRLVQIRSTLNLETVEVSEALWRELEGNPRYNPLTEPRQMVFDANGTLRVPEIDAMVEKPAVAGEELPEW